MAKKLVIVESPAKAKTINKILGGDFKVLSSMGHVRDLPERTMGVDIEHNFEPKYVLVKTRVKVVSELKKEAHGASEIYLAPDPDREGESIAWHLKELLAPDNPGARFTRVQYNEITPDAVRNAFAHPGEIDRRRVDAQQARRVLDRLVGYRVSPLLWRRLRRGLSAGRVQSVALRLVCDREEAIRKFNPEPYWILGASVRKLTEPLDPFNVTLSAVDGAKPDIKAADVADSIRRDLDNCGLKVASVSTRRIRKRPGPPFITSSLQQAASSVFGISPSRTMRIAQGLYEGVDMGDGPTGLITYMRTDSVTVSKAAVDACRSLIRERFGNEYLPAEPNVYRSRASAQEAHEAIRPTDAARTPDVVARYLDPQALKIYTLIWNRFVSSQMAPAEIDVRTVEADAVPQSPISHSYRFRASASDVVFPGYMKTWRDEKETDENAPGEVDRLPPLSEGEPLHCIEWLSDRKETKPPPRFSEASLVKELEKNGIGRPSTYAQILSTLQDRQYVVREKRTLSPSPLGDSVNAFLVTNLPKLVEVGFTAAMEEQLDLVEAGSLDWVKMLGDFYEPFQIWVKEAMGPSADTGSVDRLLTVLEGVKDWIEPVKRGRRTFDDRHFVESIRAQRTDTPKPISDRQLQALAGTAWRYRAQLPDAEALLGELGLLDAVARALPAKPSESSVRKLAILRALDLGERERNFVDSLAAWVEQGRALTDPQRNALDNIVRRYAARIEGFDTMAAELELTEAAAEDKVSGPLLKAMESVTDWHEPTTRGKRVFDDRAFCASLQDQFGKRGSLSPRQQEALKRVVVRYREQVPEFASLAADHGLRIPEPRTARRAKADAGEE